MADQPTDPRWPPSDNIDFDSVFSRLMQFKRQYLPEHTARDVSDPYIQLLRLVAAMGQHGLERLNHALKQLNPKTATSRRALISLLEIVNRPLVPSAPARGSVYTKLAAAPVIDTVYVEEGVRIIPSGISDPLYTVDTSVGTAASVAFSVWFWDSSTDAVTPVSLTTITPVDVGDAWIIGFDTLQYDALAIVLSIPHAGAQVYCLEYYNAEWGTPNSVTVVGAQLRVRVDDYLHVDTVDPDSVAGLVVTVTHKPTSVSETVQVEVYSGTSVVAMTSLLGQVSASTSVSDYEVIAEWRPVPSPVDGTVGFTTSGTISFSYGDLRSETDWWEEHPTYGYAIRLRNVSGTGLPEDVTLDSVAIGTRGSYYVTVDITQGYTSTYTLAQTDGTPFQFIPLTSQPLQEPVHDPAVTVQVGTDSDWSVVDDFSNSGASSKHAVLREDVDDGWGIMFGDGTIGVLPDSGSSVRVTHRSGSSKPGDLDAGTAIKAVSSSGLVKAWTLPRALTGYSVPECSTAAGVKRFRMSVLPQLALRAESVVTPDEIVAAMSGGAPNRATFETSDGRRPFSRAMWTTDGAGARQYRVIVVGDLDDRDGTVSAADILEAERWLNGKAVGVQIVGGHGPQNTEAAVGSFVGHSLLPEVLVRVHNAAGVRDQVDQVLRSMISPHAVDDTGAWRWEFGGLIPIAALFGRLWEAVPGRTQIALFVIDSVGTHGVGDTIVANALELPVMSAVYDPLVHIVVEVV